MTATAIEIGEMGSAEIPLWAAMRLRLWPDCTPADNAADIAALREGRSPLRMVYLAFVGARAVGFVEISERSVADGCNDGPVAYIEGWYVEAAMRRQGIGTALVRAAMGWARSEGYAWFASDTPLRNLPGQRAHEALGFEETGRVVNYRLRLNA